MKTSAVIASALLSAFTIAAPVDKRALVYHTEVVTETVVVYTTVYDDDSVPAATATATSQGSFYEQPETTTSVVVVPTSSAAAAPEVEESSSTPAPQTSTPAPVATSSPAPVVEQPTSTSAYVAPVVASSAAPVVASPSTVSQAATADTSSGTSSGASYSNVDMTVYDNTGAAGACGTALYDTDFIVALAQPAWGVSTYNVQTGAATNPWCGQKIQIQYNGNTVDATIMDMCPSCLGDDIDVSRAVWSQITDGAAGSRVKASWSKSS